MPPEKAILVNVSTEDGVIIACLAVPQLTDVAQVDAFYEKIQQALKGVDIPRLVVSLDGVRFLCSSAIAKLCALYRLVVAKGHGKLAICDISPEIHETLRLMRLDRLLPLYEGQQESLASMRF